jgi:cyclopropane fatty-acyl-phospholipid synthase-like methyltransferase
MFAGLRRSLASYHAVHLTEDPARRIVWAAVARHLADYVPPDAAVLEIGAGYCDWINHVHAARRVAVDIWPELPAFAAPGVETMVLDVSSDLQSLGPASFDVVLASNLLEHFPPAVAESVVVGVASVLRRGGSFVIVQPNFRYAWRHYFDDYTHRSIFTHVSLPALLRAHGFRIVEVRPKFLPYSMRGARVPITAFLVRAYLRSPVKPMAGQMLVVAIKD